jgi:diguanylate cyclase (GGDEF)-like protein
MHRLLKRQLKVFLDNQPLTEQLQAMFDAVSDAYEQQDDDRMQLERSLEILSQEMQEKNQALAIELKERRAAESQLNYITNYDEVTGLVNRNLLTDRMHQAMSQAQRFNKPVTILLVGLDNFKIINETLGLSLGDKLLKTIASLLTTCVRACDTVARLGGDEFALVLSASGEDFLTAQDSVADISQRILTTIAQMLAVDGHDIQITCSIGTCDYPRDGDNLDELLKNAGAALSSAKQLGGNNAQRYTPNLREKINEKLLFRTNLYHALERNEFILHYQPQVDLRTGKIAGLEALIRWLHPKLGMVPPGQFIPLSEETGLIIPIGAWVIRTACQQQATWTEKGYGSLRVAVNLSAKQFLQQNLVQMIAAVLNDTGIDPSCLEIELTESCVMKDVERSIEVLYGIKSLGVKLSIDDFGTGYSSLSYLKRLPIDVLKIDQSFVRDITVDKDGAAISKAIISLAHSLGLTVIAEGVETEAQCDFLGKNACDEMQGFFFSRGLAAQDLEVLLRDARCLPQHLVYGSNVNWSQSKISKFL